MVYVLKKVSVISDKELVKLDEITKAYIKLTAQYHRADNAQKKHIILSLNNLYSIRETILKNKQVVWEAVKIK